MGGPTGLRIGIDVGGTKIIAAEVSERGQVGPVAAVPTPPKDAGVSALEDAITAAVEQAAGRRAIASVGLAAAGFVDADRTRVRFAPHLAWRGEQVGARLSERWGAPVLLENDANCAALAENAYGAAQGASSALLVALGTGIGGAVLTDGVLWRGTHGMAGEFGHRILVRDGRPCPCGLAGCWEQYCSGRALQAYMREATGREWSGTRITEAAQEGDAVARAAFTEIGTRLGQGVAGLVAGFDPEVVVIAGGVSAAGDLLLAPAREAFDRDLVGGADRPPARIVVAECGPLAGLIGASLLGGYP